MEDQSPEQVHGKPKVAPGKFVEEAKEAPVLIGNGEIEIEESKINEKTATKPESPEKEKYLPFVPKLRVRYTDNSRRISYSNQNGLGVSIDEATDTTNFFYRSTNS